MAIWLASFHALAALTLAALVALVAGTNPLPSRAGVFAAGAATLLLWGVGLTDAALEWQTPRAYPWWDALLPAGWMLILVAVSGASPGARFQVARAAGAGFFTAAAALAVVGASAPAAITSIGLSAAGLWLLGEVSRASHVVPKASWRPFAVVAAVALVLNMACTVAWVSASTGTSLLLLARGLAVLPLVPLIVLCTRPKELGINVFVSRQVMTAVFIACTGFFAVLLPAFSAYRLVEGLGGVAAFIVSIGIAVTIGAALVAMFGRRHALWVRVQLSKHFYRLKYDYREEWLRLTNTLSSSRSDLTLPKRAIKGLADMVSSHAGALFVLEQGTDTYVAAASWNTDVFSPLEEYRRDALIAFMEKAAWIVDSREYKAEPPKESPSFLDEVLRRADKELLVVPLLVGTDLFGFVVLERPDHLRRLTFEDIDVLRTGGREVAGHLAQYYLAQRLAEAKQFEDFGRMTAFLVHDLTNISSQQSLILQNAERHRNNAHFIDDAMRTIAGSVDRINRLVALVRSGVRRSEPAPVDVATAVQDAVRLCASFKPPPRVTLPETALTVLIEADRLSHGLAHLIRNSQQAASANGTVLVTVQSEADCAVIKVSDDGTGMSADFVQERLFRPFDSTKSDAGLGIGAFQIREVVKASGGTLGVQTTKGAGSVFSIRLPLYTPRAVAPTAASA